MSRPTAPGGGSAFTATAAMNGSMNAAGARMPTAGLRAGATALPTRERRPGHIALLAALIIGLAAVGAVLYSRAGAKTPVVEVVQAVPAGHVIERADLSTVAVAGEVTAIAGTGLDDVVGQTAAVDLLPHMLLQRSMLTRGGPLAPGQALVGVAVGSGQLPADGLSPGELVRVIGLPAKDVAATTGAEPQATVLVASARVFSAHPDAANAGSTDVSLILSTDQATQVAADSAAGLIALVQVSGS